MSKPLLCWHFKILPPSLRLVLAHIVMAVILSSKLTMMNNDNDGSTLSRDFSTPLLTSALAATDGIDVQNGSGSAIPSSSESCEVHPREYQPIGDNVTALTLAMIIFYNVTGKPSEIALHLFRHF